MYPKTLLTTLAVALVSIAFAATEISTRQDYIEEHKVLAINQMHYFGIPASIILAQAILESGNGEGKLAIRANNHFGIKCKSYWQGDTYDMEDDDYDTDGNLTESCFRAYPSVEDSYRNYGEFLSGSTRYAELFTYGNDYERWAFGLKAKGYATADGYAERLINLIEENELFQFDKDSPVHTEPELIVPVTRESTGQLLVSNIAKANEADILSTTYMREPTNLFELSTPVTREEIEAAEKFRYRLISPVFREDVARLPNRAIICESPAELISQPLGGYSFARR